MVGVVGWRRETRDLGPRRVTQRRDGSCRIVRGERACRSWKLEAWRGLGCVRMRGLDGGGRGLWRVRGNGRRSGDVNVN
jgi:hypothetical protein